MPAEDRKSGDAFLRNWVFSRTLNEIQELGKQQKDGRKRGLAIARDGQGIVAGKEGIGVRQSGEGSSGLR